jgi:calcineurin-like phosphoesterase family protein
MSQTFFTSDLHFGHANIIKFCDRPFGNAEEMNRMIIQNWNSVVQPEDTVYVLGDVSFATPAETSKLLSELNGTLHLIRGNHDKDKYITCYINAFETIDDLKEIKIIEPQSGEKLRFTLCHYPMTAWNRSHHGTFHLYGHVHGTYDAPNLSMDVGIDTHPEFRPYSLNEILIKLYKKTKCELVKKTGKD